MVIHNIRINGYGKLKNKDINFNNKINIIYGENESGKSTIFNFILNTLFGASKNKKGKDISDLERFTPWNNEEFSGKIEYSLDNGDSYNVYREFKKKSPAIYDKNGEDITSRYVVDKNNGNQFFYDQTKIDEELFLLSTAVMQRGSRIESADKNSIIQKLSNLAGTGSDNISFKKSIDKLNKKQLTEIGTPRSQDRPINKIEKKLEELKKEKKDLLLYKDEKYVIEENTENIKEKIKEIEKDITELKEYSKLEQKLILEQEKIKINKQINEANNLEIKEIEEQKSNKEKELSEIKNKNNLKINSKKYILIFSIILIINILILKLFENNFKYLSLISIFIFFVFYFINIKNKKKILKEKNKKIINNKKEEINKINSQLEILKNNADTVQKEIEKLENNLNNEILDKDKIRNSQEKLEDKNNELNNLIIKLHSIELDRNNILPKLDNLSNIEEEISSFEEEKKNLINKNESIELAKEVLEEAYKIMRENITPKFAENLSNIISNISNGKYSKIKITENNDLVVELETGKIVPVELLSTGTIEQLYLSFRLAVIKELTNENMPLILDEAYAYYDDNRLENILKYLSNIDKQIIILTCTNREKDILDKIGINYNYIKI